MTVESARPDGAALTRRIEWRVWRATVTANLVGVLFIAFDAASIAPVLPSIATGRLIASPGRLIGMCAAVAVPYFSLGATLGVLHIRRRFRPTMRWLTEGREPSSEERLELTSQPRKLAAFPLIYWGLLPFWALPYLHYVVGFRPGALGLAKVAVAFGLSALVSFALAYFLVERALRPVQRALRAAKALHAELLSLPADGFEAAIGVSSGEVVAGNVGSADRYEYTVVGDPVNEAARLTEQAKATPGHIVVSESTIKRAGAAGESWTPASAMTLRGRSDPTLAYELAPSAST